MAAQLGNERALKDAFGSLTIYGKMPYTTGMSLAQPTARLEARLPADVHALLKRAAEIQGRTLTDFVVASAHEAAVRVIGEVQAIRLTAEESRRFAEALLEPREPTADLRAAARRYVEAAGG